jgi:hypothetical protein
VKSALSDDPVEVEVLAPGATLTRMASSPPMLWTPMVTGSMMALVPINACHCASLFRILSSEDTALDIAWGREIHEWLVPFWSLTGGILSYGSVRAVVVYCITIY